MRNMTWVEFDASSECTDVLKNGSVDALATHGPIGAGYLSKDQEGLELINKPFTAEKWGVGITKGDTAWCEFLNTTITDFYADGWAKKAWAGSLGQHTDQRAVIPELQLCT